MVKTRQLLMLRKLYLRQSRDMLRLNAKLLALIFGVKKFHQYLWGRRFTLYTDHKPLTAIFGSKKGIPVTAASRLQRWALILMGYTYHIEYKSTQHFGNADGLSRLAQGPDVEFDNQIIGYSSLDVDEVNVVSAEVTSVLPVTAAAIAKETSRDHVLSRVYRSVLEGWSDTDKDCELQQYRTRHSELSVLNGCILLGMRTCHTDKVSQRNVGGSASGSRRADQDEDACKVLPLVAMNRPRHYWH
ncbi:uncharacterized protein LOC135389732 [Ornithodoros turicata]|uniref:uncharacterized protein LOC135389732 n=1 Tax=Ornithodoros turicata TaxID=34597 RepID=UPI00313885FF